jgi:hypothetical protein
MDRLMMYVAEGGSKRHPLGRSAADEVLIFAPEFSRSLGLALILLEAQG